MASWIVVLVVLALMGSVFWIVPSARDRQRMRLRQLAMREGLKVRVPDKALKERLVRYEDIVLGTMLYESLSFSKRRTAFQGALYILKEEGGSWVFTDQSVPAGVDREAVFQAMQVLPASCGLAMLTTGSASVFWNEAGEPEDVEKIKLALDRVNHAMV
ncbi:hypothetical protein [Alkalimarinus coralli]|uniref:hypothetical protein n=1 Tax=Alkalimarinus coralli TaxID=2935863 RepID=UPI00202AC7F7|nr:hypothetical protein [Alkalimarinus coralli]